eukprot:365149-Chlamydomonas_euryale.AAC.13
MRVGWDARGSPCPGFAPQALASPPPTCLLAAEPPTIEQHPAIRDSGTSQRGKVWSAADPGPGMVSGALCNNRDLAAQNVEVTASRNAGETGTVVVGQEKGGHKPGHRNSSCWAGKGGTQARAQKQYLRAGKQGT